MRIRHPKHAPWLTPPFRNFGFAVMVLSFVLLLGASAPARAEAASPQPFWDRCVADVEPDVQCSGPRGVATAPATAGAGVAGNVYVADSFNARIVAFTPWGSFVRSWGWDVVQTGPDDNGGGFEICVPSNGDVCKAGVGGVGAGQFGDIAGPQGVAVDSAGNVYVVDHGIPSNQRVQKFDPEGHFLRMWGKGVNIGTAADKEICTNAGPPTDVCGAGGEGSGPGQFGALPPVGSYIGVDTAGTATAADDRVYVGDQGRIQRFDSDGKYLAEIAVPGETVRALAVDPSGNLYASFCANAECIFNSPAKANVRKWSSVGAEQPPITVSNPQALATGPSGNLYVESASSGASNPTIRQFSPAGAEILEEKTTAPFFPTFPFTPGFSESTGIATGSACMSAGYDLYLTAPNGLRAYGPPPDNAALCPPPLHAPEIEDQGTLAVEPDLATVQARINPQFWADTSYFVQYGTAACVEGEAAAWAAPCVAQTPGSPAALGAGVTDVGAKTAKVVLGGLTPDTEYRYRFVAQSSGGGTVFGAGGTEAADGASASFMTPGVPAPLPSDNCGNSVFRSGSSAFLPDCRAYEMVSPVDKNGGDISGRWDEAYVQASSAGNRITYTAEAAFGDQPSNKLANQYLASRIAGVGWSNRGIAAPLGKQLQPGPARETGIFSPDLCSNWIVDFNAIPLTPEAPAGYANLYQHDLCGAGGFEALIGTAPPPPAGPTQYVSVDSVQGYSKDLGHVFFVARAKLTDDASDALDGNEGTGAPIRQLYDYQPSDGSIHLVSVRPDGTADPGVLAAGAELGGGAFGLIQGTLRHAVSEDGSRAFWTSASTEARGTLYLREHPEQGIVAGECSEAAIACTVKVSNGAGSFWGATPSGSEALYSEGQISESGAGVATLYRFDVATETRTPVAAGVRGVLGASENLSRVYFVSTDLLTPGQQNSEEDEAQAGKPNLYLDEEGVPIFVATLLDGAGGDIGGAYGDKNTYSIGSVNPHFNAARVSPDGARVVFESRARLTGFDNTDLDTGKAAVEVFTYRAGGALRCVSCNDTGVRPAARELPVSYRKQSSLKGEHTGVFAAAWIPALEHPLAESKLLSENGNRIFFNSNTPLVLRDTNGAQDVYEWEAPGEGSCAESSAAYHELNGGCLYLISSGESPSESEFWDASPDGNDVFLTTESSLLPQDPGSVDLYDARAGGGFAQPAAAAACEGEACQAPTPAPDDPTPASSAFEGAGNVPKSGKKPCPKGKVRRHGSCAKKKHGKGKYKRAQHRPASHDRRTAR